MRKKTKQRSMEGRWFDVTSLLVVLVVPRTVMRRALWCRLYLSLKERDAREVLTPPAADDGKGLLQEVS